MIIFFIFFNKVVFLFRLLKIFIFFGFLIDCFLNSDVNEFFFKLCLKLGFFFILLSIVKELELFVSDLFGCGFCGIFLKFILFVYCVVLVGDEVVFCCFDLLSG